VFAGSNPAGGVDVCLLQVLYVVAGRDLCEGPITRPGEILPSLECVIVCDYMQQ
jgi:hypothetical protein